MLTSISRPPLAGAVYPDESTGARLRALVALAALAPSGHNTQPWRFRIAGDTIELCADRTRALPVVDPHDRALVISCGAALGTLRAAIRADGHIAEIARLPDRRDPDLLARVRLGASHLPTRVDLARRDAIARRHTSRRAFETREVPATVLSTLQQLARSEGASLRQVTAFDEKHRVADLVAEGDRRQASDPAFRRELATWIHRNHSRARDGMPGSAFGLGNLTSVAFPWIIRTVDWGRRQAARDRRLALRSPVLLVLSTSRDTPHAWLRAGEALALLLLDATAAGLVASFLNQPIEVPRLRSSLARALSVSGAPQLLLRLGYAARTAPTPRRALDEMIAD